MSYNERRYDIMYIGEFSDGRYQGFGVQFYETNMGESYLSSYCTAEPESDTYQDYYLTWANPVAYFGEFQSGERHGKGNAFILSQAEIYFGAMGEIDLDAPEYEISICEYRSGEKDGVGTIYAPNGYLPMSVDLTATSTTAMARNTTTAPTCWNMKATTKTATVTEPEPAISRMEQLPIPENGSMTIISKAYVCGGYLLHRCLTIRKQLE